LDTTGKRQEVIDALLESYEPDFFDAVELNLVDRVRRHLKRDAGLADAPAGRGNLLRWAASRNMREMVAVLLDAGARRALTDGQGQTALDLARAAGHDEIVALLE